MNNRILLVGENPTLLTTRAMLLSSWITVTVSPTEAMQLLKAERFQGIVLCQTVETHLAEAIIAQAMAIETVPAILAVRVPGEPELLGVRNHINNLWESPAWLRAEMSALLASRINNLNDQSNFSLR